MCGLVGVAGNIQFSEKRVFANLLFMDQLRGKHSTGVAAIDKDSKVELFKEVGPPMNLFAHKDWFDDDFEIKRYGLKALIGHNRYATVGAKTADNAHPFHHGDVVGAHNGTLKYIYQIPEANKFQVDSEAIFYNFNKLGVKETMAHLNGAWALTWYNTESETMNFMRNDERPLYYVYTKDEDCLFWASDPEMLTLALDYSPVKYDPSGIFQFKPFLHYTLDMKGGLSVKNKSFEYDEEEIKGFTPPVASYQNHNHNTGYGNYFRDHANANLNVIAQGNRGTPPDDEEMKRMKAYVGKDIEFFIKGERMDYNKVPYLLAESVASNEYWEIRLYAKDHKRRAELLKDNGNSSYNAKVRKVNKRWDHTLSKPDVYMLIDLRTISEPSSWDTPMMDPNTDFLVIGGPDGTKGGDNIPFDWTPDLEYIGYKGEKLSYDQFIIATRHGCDWCCEDAENLHDPSKLKFFTPDSFICPICNRDGTASLYYRYAM